MVPLIARIFGTLASLLSLNANATRDILSGNGASNAPHPKENVMTYDPTKKENWLICSSGFWREGIVSKSAHMVLRYCTWQEAKDTSREIAEMYARFTEEKRQLETIHQAECDAYFS